VSALLVAVSVLFTGLAYFEMRKSALAGAQTQLAQIATQFVQLLAVGFSNVATSMRRQGAAPEVTEFLESSGARGRAEVLRLLAVNSNDQQFVGAQLWDAAGNLQLTLGGVPEVQSRVPSLLARATRAPADSVVVGSLLVANDSILYPLALRLASEGVASGFLVMWRRLAALPGTRKQLAGLLGAGTNIFIGNPEDSAWTDLEHVVPGPPRVATAVAIQSYNHASHGQVFAVASRTPGTPFFVVVERSGGEVLAAPHQFLLEAVLVALTILSAAILGTLLLARRFTTPLLQLADAAKRVADGDFSTASGMTHTADELGQLSRAFDTMVARVRDAIDARLRSEHKLHQAQKLDAVGQLASGIAHDFNNVLTIVVANADFLIKALPPTDNRRTDAEAIRSAAESAANLVRQLLIFARQDVVRPEVVDLNDAIDATSKLLHRFLREDIQLVTALAASPALAMVDAGQFEQVIVNLVVNARDAMPNGGRLVIETRNVSFSDSSPEFQPYTAGNYVCIMVTDTGVGMNSEIRDRLFEPFFTTKGPGKGTGLGLATVHGIIEAIGGKISVYSEEGSGTTFRIYLPLVDPEPGSDSSVSADRLKDGTEVIDEGTETVLVVEDQPGVRAVLRKILERHHYRVLEAPDPDSALATAARFSERIPLVISDVVMPQMNGRELADRLSETRPDIKVLFISGYTQDSVLRRGVVNARMHYIEKPFDQDGLLRKVREILDTGEAYRLTREEPG